MQDFHGAKKFILKALQLYPPLKGAAHMLAICDVHIAAQVKVGSNETNWYGILQTEPTSDDSVIRRQYCKLAILLHPDKNQAKEVENAFKLIGEAFRVLSERNKRFVHDSKRHAEARVVHPASYAFEPLRPTNATYQSQYQGVASAHATTAANNAQGSYSSPTFWTACPLCRMQYQYMRMYLGYQLLCQKCHKPFLANDINAPTFTPVANGTTMFTWNNRPFLRGSFLPAPKRAEMFNFQTWKQNNGVIPSTVPINGQVQSPWGIYTMHTRNYPSESTPSVGASSTTTMAGNLVQEAYQSIQRDRMVVGKTKLKRRTKEDEKIARQQEKEAMKKACDAAKIHEAQQKLTKKRDEALEKEVRRKAATRTRTKRRLKKKKRNDDDDEDEDEEIEDVVQSNCGYGSQTYLTWKSSRYRKKVAYDIDGEPSDDDDFEFLPGAKKSKATTNSGDVGHNSKMEKGSR